MQYSYIYLLSLLILRDFCLKSDALLNELQKISAANSQIHSINRNKITVTVYT